MIKTPNWGWLGKSGTWSRKMTINYRGENLFRCNGAGSQFRVAVPRTKVLVLIENGTLYWLR